MAQAREITSTLALSRRRLICLALASVATGSLAACTSSQENAKAPTAAASAATSSVASAGTGATTTTAALISSTSAAVAGQLTTVTFLVGMPVGEANAAQKAITAFQSANPTIKVNWINSPQGFTQKLDTMAAGGDPPDMYRNDGPSFAAYAYRGFMLPLDAYMSRDHFDKSDFYPVAFSQYQWQGKQLGISSDVGNRMIFYNADLWKAANLSDPLPDWSAAGWTFNDFRQHAAALTQAKAGATQFGFVNVTDWMTWPLANGGALWNADSTDSMVDKPEAIEAFQFLQDLMFKDKVAETKDQETEIAPSQAFLTGRSGMTVAPTATGMTSYRPIKAFTWNVIAIPRGPALSGDRRCFGGGSGWFIYRTTKLPDETWKLFTTMTSPATSSLLAAQGFAPARLSIARSAVWMDPRLPPAAHQVVTDGPNYIVPFPKTTTWTEWVDTVNSQLDLLWTNRISAKDLAPKLKTAAAPLVQKHLLNMKNLPPYYS